MSLEQRLERANKQRDAVMRAAQADVDAAHALAAECRTRANELREKFSAAHARAEAAKRSINEAAGVAPTWVQTLPSVEAAMQDLPPDFDLDQLEKAELEAERAYRRANTIFFNAKQYRVDPAKRRLEKGTAVVKAKERVEKLERMLESEARLRRHEYYTDNCSVSLQQVKPAPRRADKRITYTFECLADFDWPEFLQHEYTRTYCRVNFAQLQNLVCDVRNFGAIGLRPSQIFYSHERAVVLRAIADVCASPRDAEILRMTAQWLYGNDPDLHGCSREDYLDVWNTDRHCAMLIHKDDMADPTAAAKRWFWVLCDAYPALFENRKKRSSSVAIEDDSEDSDDECNPRPKRK